MEETEMRRWIALLLAVLLGSAILVGCSEKDRTVLEIEGHEIPYSEYEIYFNNEKLKIAEATERSYEEVKDIKLGEDGTTYESVAIGNAKSNLLYNRLCALEFEERGLEYDDELKERTEQLFKENEERAGGSEVYQEKLKKNGLTEEQQKEYFKAFVLNEALAQALYGPEGENPVSEEELENELTYNYYWIQPLGINKIENHMYLTGTALEEKKQKYEEVKSRLEAGEDFTTLLEEYGELNLSAQELEHGILVNTRLSGNTDYKEVIQSDLEAQPGQVIYGETDTAFYALNWMPIDETVREWAMDQVKKDLMSIQFERYMEQKISGTSYSFSL